MYAFNSELFIKYGSKFSYLSLSALLLFCFPNPLMVCKYAFSTGWGKRCSLILFIFRFRLFDCLYVADCTGIFQNFFIRKNFAECTRKSLHFFFAYSIILWRFGNGFRISRQKTQYAAMAQQVEHVLGKDEVTGSNPVSSSRRKTTKYCGFSLVLRVKNTN